MIFGSKYRKSVFMVTYFLDGKNIKYLVLKRKLNWRGYEFPKGGIERGESRFEAVKREIFEETGLSVKKIKNHHKKGKWNYKNIVKERPGLKGQSWSLFSVEVNSQDVKVDPREHVSFEWLDYESALKKLTFENQKKCLQIVNDWLGK